MKTLYLHVGTHKTGTTSIQKWLHEQSAMLLDVGVLVPQMGRPFQNTSGHHNLAWELSGDPRFSEAYGTRRELFDELSSICHESVILSSEDFGCVSNKPDVLKSFLDEFRKNDYQVNLIVYLRDPIDYGVSLHGEYKKQLSFQDVTENASLDELRCKTDPRNFVSEITKAKSYHLRDALPCFQDFNYARLVGNYERAAGTENVFVRAYSHDVIDDFAALIGLQHLPGVGVIRENRSNLPDPEINSLKDALREQGPTASDEFKAFIAQRAVQLNDPLERIRPLLAPAVGFIPERLTDVQSWRGHLCFVPVIMQAVKPAVFVELGVHKGDSYSAFCQAAQSFNLNTRCYGVDTWEGDHQAGFYGDEIYSELKNYHDSRYSQFSELLRKTFDEASAFFENGNIDLLHIDGLHTYEAVKHDFESWLPKLSAKAVVLFHDTVVRHDDFGVWKFWSELENKYPSFQFFHSHGLGVLQVGKHLPDVFAKLSQLDARASSALRGAVYQQSRLVIQAKAEAE